MARSDIEPIRKALAKAKLPRWVARAEVAPMVNHMGEPALRVTLVIRDDREEILTDGRALNDAARRVHVAIDATGETRWPYTGFVIAHEAA